MLISRWKPASCSCLSVKIKPRASGRTRPFGASRGAEGGRWSDRFVLGRHGPQVSVVATVLPYVLNGYMSIKARMTSTGEGKI